MMCFALFVLCWASHAGVCKSTHASLASVEQRTALPAAVYVASQAKAWGYQVSPDGEKLLWLALHKGKASVHFRSLTSTRVSVLSARQPVRWAYWAADSRYISMWADNRGDENYHLYVGDSDQPRRAVRNLTNQADVRVFFHQALRTEPPAYLVRHNQRDATLTDLVQIQLDTGASKIIAQNTGETESWITDSEGGLVGRIQRHADYSWSLQRYVGASWQDLISGDAEERFVPQGHQVPGSTIVWALSNRGRDRIALVKVDLRSGAETVYYEHPFADVESAWIDASNGQPRAAWSWPALQEAKWFDSILHADQALLAHLQPYVIRYTSESTDKRLATITIETAQSGKSHYLIDRRSPKLILLAASSVATHAQSMAPMRAIRLSSSDGLTLHGYLTLPAEKSPGPLPTVVIVHGGPFSRDRWGYKGVDQFLASRGYVVARVNFRGSTGYGRRFVEAAQGQFARKMHSDIIDTVNWLVDKGVTDPQAVAIYGVSYGGYAALVGVTETPNFFQAAVNIVGPADLQTLLDTGPAYWRLHRANWFRFIGNPDKLQDRIEMAKRSPINHVQRIVRPVLIVQGGRDVRVARTQSEKLVSAMKDRGVEVEYVLLDDEGHVFRKLDSHIKVARVVEKFLHRHLGGRWCQ